MPLGLLQINIPRLANGYGSMIKVNMLVSPRSNTIQPFSAYATYDQGSAKYPPSIDLLDDPILPLIGLALAFVAFFVPYWYRRLRKIESERREFFITKILIDVLGVKNDLLTNPMSSSTFKALYSWELWIKYSDKLKRELIIDNDRYNLLSDFYRLIDQRDQNISTDNEAQLRDQNLQVQEKALLVCKEIPWSQYIVK